MNLLLAIQSHKYYAVHVPEKKGNRRGNLKYIKAHWPRNAAFLRVYAVARLLWAAIVGGFGLLVSFGVPVSNLLFAAPLLGKSGNGLTIHRRSLP
ncbi:hypothetical protein H8K32_19850 [Undibacterium jejuense]|uniref:Uncharacterized protein n=1 Tax=Undibacterium jejuense TaxID=1344949 RepID=A0A923HJS8_9BURK|nr:hypothetical protein [Undibacterium jejuense]MBC3864355.1 hypothetical protein [Undibacterium jejuense]